MNEKQKIELQINPSNEGSEIKTESVKNTENLDVEFQHDSKEGTPGSEAQTIETEQIPKTVTHSDTLLGNVGDVNEIRRESENEHLLEQQEDNSVEAPNNPAVDGTTVETQANLTNTNSEIENQSNAVEKEQVNDVPLESTEINREGNSGTELDPNATEEKPKFEFRQSDGVVDYATQYKKVIDDERELIQSATYFVSLRKQYMAEVMGSWDEISKDIPLEVAEVLLNEFLSPKFTLMEFEFRNLTKAGREEREEDVKEETLSEIWQKHILGKVLTDKEENKSSVLITVDEKGDGETDVTKETETGTKDGETSDYLEEADLTDADKEVAKCAVEIFSKINLIYKRIKWFIRHIDVDKLNVCNQLKRAIRTGIITFNRSFSVTWRVVNCLVYLEILESVRKDATNALTNVLQRMNRMLVEERMGIFTEESGNLLKIAHLFIDKYRQDLNEDALFRRGFGYLSRKLTKLKKDNTNGPLIMNVASHLASEESKISEVHQVLKEVFDFDILKL